MVDVGHYQIQRGGSTMSGLIKSDINVAESMKSLFEVKGNIITKQSVTNATETTLSAVANGKSVYQQAEDSINNYKEILLADAKNIASLGQEFAQVDAAIGANVRQQF